MIKWSRHFQCLGPLNVYHLQIIYRDQKEKDKIHPWTTRLTVANLYSVLPLIPTKPSAIVFHMYFCMCVGKGEIDKAAHRNVKEKARGKHPELSCKMNIFLEDKMKMISL